MANPPRSIGPFSGVNNVHKPDSGTFQLPGELERRLPALVAATDVDLDDDGWPASRLSTASVQVLINGLGGWEVGNRIFFQDGDSLYEGVTKGAALITGLRRRVSICEHWGLIFVTDGTNHYEIDGSTVRVWGLPVPEIELSPAGGSLVPGTYFVQATFIDARGNEGGTSDIASAMLSASTGILVSVSGQSQECVAANVYVSRRNQKTTSYLVTVALDEFPYTIQHDDVTAADPPKTLQMTGPINDAAGIFSFRAFMLMWRDGVVFRSEAAEPHLMHGARFMQFGSDIRACEGMAGGMWIGTETGLWWVQGEDPSKWVPTRKTLAAVTRGSKQVQGLEIPKLQSDDKVALFVTADGLVAGTSDGRIVPITYGVYKFDAAQRATITYSYRDNLKQVVISLVGDA